MDVGKRIKQRRKEIKISAEDLAEVAEVSPSTIYRYEKGDIENMPTPVLDKIARKLRVSPSYLMGWDEDYTIAAHIDDDVTEEEMQDIRDYIKYIKSKRS